jgi:hypothetical protein
MIVKLFKLNYRNKDIIKKFNFNISEDNFDEDQIEFWQYMKDYFFNHLDLSRI